MSRILNKDELEELRSTYADYNLRYEGRDYWIRCLLDTVDDLHRRLGEMVVRTTDEH